MTARTVLATVGILLALAPAAQAATSTAYDPVTDDLTITNGAEGEAFEVSMTYQSSAPAGFVYRVDGGTQAIPLGGSTCTNPGGDGTVILCEPDDNVDKVILDAGGGSDAITISGSPYYYDFGNPGLQVNGQGADDTFTAGPGGALVAERVVGGPGNDTFNGSAAERDSFLAEPGDDTYRGGTKAIPAGADGDAYQRFYAADSWDPVGETPINISLDGVGNDTDGQGGTDNVFEVEDIEGTDGNDTLTAATQGVSFSGDDGDDTLTGSPEGDSLGGQAGNDALRGLAGDDELSDGDFDDAYRLSADPPRPVFDDSLDGGDGNDAFSVGAGRDDVVGGAGTDLISTSRFVTQVFEGTVPSDFRAQTAPVSISLNDQADDGVTGANEGDNVRSDVEDVATGGLFGGWMVTRGFSVPPLAAADTVTGSAAANAISTGGGDDRIEGGPGPDRIDAGFGDDMVNAVDQGTDTIQCGRGTDSVGADLPGTNPGRADVLTECETVTGTPLSLEGGALPTAPGVTFGGADSVKVKKFLRTYTVATDVTTDQQATVAGELLIAGAKIAKAGDLSLGTGRLAAGNGKRKLKVRVAKKFRKAIKRKLRTKKQRRKGIRLKLVVTVTNTADQATRKTRTIRVRG